MSSPQAGNTPYTGPIPVANLVDTVRKKFKLENLKQSNLMSFADDMVTRTSCGKYCVPLGLGAGFAILHMKHDAELQTGYQNSFLAHITEPASCRTDKFFKVEDYALQLMKVTCFEEALTLLRDMNARMVFETMVEVINMIADIYQVARHDAAALSKRFNLGNRDTWGLDKIEGLDNDCELINLIRAKQMEATTIKNRMINLMLAEWYRYLKDPDNAVSLLLWRYIMANFTVLTRNYFEKASKGTPAEGCQNFVVDYTILYEQSSMAIWEVLGVKVGNAMIKIKPVVRRELGIDSTINVYLLPQRIFHNLIMAGRPAVFYPHSKPQDFIYHDKENCDFNNETCACNIVLKRFPELFEDDHACPS